jgi:hypothetical protein
MSERTLHYRDQQFQLNNVVLTDGTNVDAWRFSLKALGTCSHRGVILPNAISRVARWPLKGNGWLAGVWDPQISLLNQKICGDRYRRLTAKLFGDEPEPLPEDAITPEWDQKAIDAFDPKRIEGLEVMEPWLMEV